MPAKRLTILAATINAVGHVNATMGTTRALLARGHRVIFLLEQTFKGHAAAHGFEESIFKLEVENFSQGDNATPGEDWAKGLLDQNILGLSSPEEKWANMINLFVESPEAKSLLKQLDCHNKAAIEKYRPDLIIIDTGYLLPAVGYSGIPWIQNMSISPQFFCLEESIPPPCSGLTTDAPRDDTWMRLRALHRRFYYNTSFNDLVEEQGYPRYADDRIMPNEEAFQVVYAYPEELNYPEIRAKPWFNLEVFNGNELQKTVNLKELVGEAFFSDTLDGKWSGKWVYLSMGSMGSIDLDLMKRILGSISLTTHKYLVSKGPRHAEYSLPRNAWGDRYLPQTALVPLVDLVVTHGGNNTTTETFAQGKPMLVLPLFADQIDNGARLQETQLGRRLDPYRFTAQEMMDNIEDLINDTQLKVTLTKASKRILSSAKGEELATLIESKLG